MQARVVVVRALKQNTEKRKEIFLMREVAFHKRSAETVTEAIAATGYEMLWRWRTEIARTQHAMEAASFDRRFGMELYSASMSYQRITYWPNPSDPDDRVPAYADLPSFAHQPQSIGERVAAAAPDVCLLAFECIGLLVIAGAAYLRTDI